MPGGAIYTAQVSLLQGKIAVPYSGNMSLLLATGSNVTVPVQGTYTGTTYAPAVRTLPQAWNTLLLIRQQCELWTSCLHGFGEQAVSMSMMAATLVL